MSKVVSLADYRAFLAEAAALDVWHGPNLYSKFLRQHGRRPTPEEADGIGLMMNARVRASDGRKYPYAAKKGS